MDCLGVCFGNYTENCQLDMISDHLEDSAYIYLSLDQFETDVNLTIVNLCDSYK